MARTVCHLTREMVLLENCVALKGHEGQGHATLFFIVLTHHYFLPQGVAVLESWGLNVQPHVIAERSWGYLAGRDRERRSDLEPDPPAALLACARGGWGAARLLEKPIQWKTGWLLGFSDVTTLLWARLACGFSGCVHGPMLTTLSDEPDWSQERLRRLLFGDGVPDLQGDPAGGGQAIGPLVVANLTVATHLLGTRFLPDLHGAILIFEDVVKIEPMAELREEFE